MSLRLSQTLEAVAELPTPTREGATAAAAPLRQHRPRRRRRDRGPTRKGRVVPDRRGASPQPGSSCSASVRSLRPRGQRTDRRTHGHAHRARTAPGDGRACHGRASTESWACDRSGCSHCCSRGQPSPGMTPIPPVRAGASTHGKTAGRVRRGAGLVCVYQRRSGERRAPSGAVCAGSNPAEGAPYFLALTSGNMLAEVRPGSHLSVRRRPGRPIPVPPTAAGSHAGPARSPQGCHLTHTRRRLRPNRLEHVVDLDHRLAHHHEPGIEVAVSPAQRDELTPPQRCERRHQHQRPAPRPHRVGDRVHLGIVATGRSGLSSLSCAVQIEASLCQEAVSGRVEAAPWVRA